MFGRFSFLPREEKFFDLFDTSAETGCRIVTALRYLLEDYRDVETKVKQIKDLEHEADRTTHAIFAMLNKTFIPPLDREDIARLAHTLDEVVDMIDAAAERLVVYRIPEPTPIAQRLAHIIVAQTGVIRRAPPLLRSGGTMSQALPYTVEINSLENDADEALRDALTMLFNDPSRVTHDIKWREFYEHLEMATDMAEDVANVIEGIVLKHG